MKKVLFVATVDVHINSFHLPYLKLFKENGYEVHVATNSSEKIEFCDIKHKISIKRSPFSISNIKAIVELKKIIDKEKFDIIHCHTPMGSVVARVAAKESRKKGTRVIYTAHGFHFFKGAPIVNWMFFYPIEKYLSKYTDDLITINKEDYNLAKNKFKKCKNICYIPGVGVDEKKFDFEISENEKIKLKESLNLKKDDIVLIYTAELSKRKNQIMAIKVMEKLVSKNLKYHLLLVGKDSLNGKYQDIVKKLNLENNIHFLGYRKDVNKLLKISNLAISTSKQEGLPVNIIEAIISGIPYIVTACRGNIDLADEKNNGCVVEINNVDSMYEKILKLTSNYENSSLKRYDSNSKNKYTLENIKPYFMKLYGLEKDEKVIRVLQVIRRMNIGGAETLIMNLYRNVDREKVQFDFLVTGNGIFDEEITKLGGKIYKLPYITEIGQFRYSNMLKNFFYNHKEYNIVHSHIDQVSGIILEAANKSNVPIRIAHSHNTKNSNSILGKIYKLYLQSKINSNATHYLACSKDAARWLYKDKANEAIVINNGIDLEKFKFSIKKREKIRKELKIDEDAIVIGHIGGFRTQKNHEGLIDIFYNYLKTNSNAFLVMAGIGDLQDKIRKKVEKLGIENNVKFLGVRKDADFLYSAFDVFLFPSLYEGLSVALIEAQVSGLNVLTSDTVDKNTKITDNIKFISLKDTNWNEYIVKNINRKEEISSNKELQKFNIKKTAIFYQKFIERIIKNNES